MHRLVPWSMAACREPSVPAFIFILRNSVQVKATQVYGAIFDSTSSLVKMSNRITCKVNFTAAMKAHVSL